MRYGLFDDNGNYCGYDSDNYEFAQERAAVLNERYQQGLEELFYHVEEIDDDEEQELINYDEGNIKQSSSYIDSTSLPF